MNRFRLSKSGQERVASIGPLAGVNADNYFDLFRYLSSKRVLSENSRHSPALQGQALQRQESRYSIRHTGCPPARAWQINTPIPDMFYQYRNYARVDNWCFFSIRAILD
jgi:hypothetical protein